MGSCTPRIGVGIIRILIIDNYDSFTNNLWHLVYEAIGVECRIVPNDQSVALVDRSEVDAIIISPGPGHPAKPIDVGLSAVVCQWAEVPILGVCLGHQLLGYVAGGIVERAPHIRHGHVSQIRTTDHWLFDGIPNMFSAVRYHSWHLPNVPPDYIPIAHAEDGVLMGMCHRDRPHVGLQFHPESIDTQYGVQLVRNFCRRYLSYHGVKSAVPPSEELARRPATHRLYFQRFDWRPPETVVDGLRHQYAELIWLDSSLPSTSDQQISYVYVHRFGATRWIHNPYDQTVSISKDGQTDVLEADLFQAMSETLSSIEIETSQAPFSFKGGFIGVLGYEAMWAGGAPTKDSRSYLYFADQFLVFDHKKRALYAAVLSPLSSGQEAPEWFAEVQQYLERSSGTTTTKPLNRDAHGVHAISKADYLEKIQQCKAQLSDGESYELCLTTEVTLNAPTCPWSYYVALRLTNPAPYAAYLQLPECIVACSSPEKFLSVDRSGLIEAKPIKGTRARGLTLQADQEILSHLQRSEKDRAENLMITDLLRHDVGAHSVLGSVSVPHNRAIESYATVHQMVSTIQGQKRRGHCAVSVVRDAFPGGSMTGAPKRRSVRILSQVEKRERGIYSGSIGFLSVCGQAAWNIVIRTAIIDDSVMKIGAGGAIVMASDPNDEYQEMLLKVFPLLRPLGFESVSELEAILRQP